MLISSEFELDRRGSISGSDPRGQGKHKLETLKEISGSFIFRITGQ